MSEIRDFDRVRPVNKHDLGSTLQKADILDADKKVNWNSGAVKTGVTTAAGAAGSALSGGKSTAVGSVFNTIGDIGSMIPGPYGAIIGAAGKVLGGLTNSLFGSKLNYENINTVKNNIRALNAAANVDAANYDDLAEKQKNTFAGSTFDKSYIGSDGLFSHKARKKYRSLKAQEDRAEDRYRLGTAYNADQIGQNMINNSLRNYSALGGPLEYSLANRDLDIKAAKLNNLSSAFSLPTATAYADGGLMASAVMDAVNPMNVYKRAMRDLVDAVGLDNMKTVMGMVRKNRENKMAEIALAEDVREFGPTMYAKGGKIHIKKANRGKFTAAAKRAGMSVQEYARHILANKDKYTPTLVKRANFARNASKFKHADGGYLDGYNAFLDDVINKFQTGGDTNNPEPQAAPATPSSQNRTTLGTYTDVYNRFMSEKNPKKAFYIFLAGYERNKERGASVSETAKYAADSGCYKGQKRNYGDDWSSYDWDDRDKVIERFGSKTDKKINETVGKVYDWLNGNNDFGEAQKKAIMQTISIESGFDPDAGNKYGYEGLFQLSKERKGGYDNWKKSGHAAGGDNVIQQLEYMKYTLDKSKGEGFLAKGVDRTYLDEYWNDDNTPASKTDEGAKAVSGENLEGYYNEEISARAVNKPDKTRVSQPSFDTSLYDTSSPQSSSWDEIEKIFLDHRNGRHAEGGGLATNGANFTNGLTQINEGGTHEENANEGVLMGTDQNGVPNTVEEGETIYKDYVFSNRLTIPDKIARKYHLKKGITFAEASKQLSKESEERPNDPVSQRGLDAAMQDLIAAQEEIRQARDAGKQQALVDLLAQNGEPGAQGLNVAEEGQAEETAAEPGTEDAANAQAGMGSEDQSQQLSGEDLSQLMQMAGNSGGYAYGGYVRKLGEGDDTEGTPEITPLPTWQRQAPLYGLALQSLTDAFGLTNNPDYTEAETLRSMAYRTPRTVSYSPTATYLNLRPMDINSTVNALRADAAAKDRMALDMAGVNRGLAAATMLSNRYATDNAIGKVYNDLLTYNNGIREKMAAHNQAVNQHNADQALAAATTNASNYNAVAALNNDMLNAAMTQRTAERNAVDAAKAANWSNFLTSLGNYGTENLNQNALNFLIASGGYGPIDQKFWPLLNLLLGNNKPAAKKTAKASSSTEKRGGSKSTDSGNRGVYMTEEGLPNWNYVEYWNDILD